jgi:hypothetical protein
VTGRRQVHALSDPPLAAVGHRPEWGTDQHARDEGPAPPPTHVLVQCIHQQVAWQHDAIRRRLRLGAAAAAAVAGQRPSRGHGVTITHLRQQRRLELLLPHLPPPQRARGGPQQAHHPRVAHPVREARRGTGLCRRLATAALPGPAAFAAPAFAFAFAAAAAAAVGEGLQQAPQHGMAQHGRKRAPRIGWQRGRRRAQRRLAFGLSERKRGLDLQPLVGLGQRAALGARRKLAEGGLLVGGRAGGRAGGQLMAGDGAVEASGWQGVGGGGAGCPGSRGVRAAEAAAARRPAGRSLSEATAAHPPSGPCSLGKTCRRHTPATARACCGRSAARTRARVEAGIQAQDASPVAHSNTQRSTTI